MQIIAHNLGMLLRIPPKLLLIMRLTTFILIIALAQVSAKGFGQKITLNTNHTPIEKVLQSIRDQSGYRIFYDADDLKNQHVTLNINNLSVEEAIKATIKGLPLNYKIVKNSIVLSKEEPSFLERFFRDDDDGKFADIRGVVRNERGEALEGITVMVKGAKTGTRTNAKGEFVLKGVKKGDVLVFTGVAIEPFEYIVKDDKNIDLNLKARLVQLEEVGINTGYQKISKERFVGSYSQLDSAAFHRRAGMGIIERLDGTVPGVLFNKKSGVGVSPIQIRGISSLSLQNPLIVVDNFPMDSRFDINNINPNDVENVTVLKDAAAASIWGAKAGNGVIVITTKKGKYNHKSQISTASIISIDDKPNLFYHPRISVSDYIDIEKELFAKGFYNRNLNNRFTWPVLSPVVELLSKVGKNGFSQADADSEIDKLRRVDLREELSELVYRNAMRQQHSVSLSGGSNNLNYQLSAGYNSTITNIQGDKGSNQFTLRSNTGYKPFKGFEIIVGLNYVQGKSRSIPFSLPVNAAPYLKLADENGNSLAIPYNIRTAYLDTLSQRGLLDWSYRPLDEIRLANKELLSSMVDINVNTSYAFTSWLTGNVAYNYRMQSNSDRNFQNLQSYNTRSLINYYFNPSASSELQYPIPLGGILDLGNTQSVAKNLRLSLNIDEIWAIDHKFSALIGFDRSENKGFYSTNRLYGYDDRNGSYNQNIDYFNFYPRTFASFPGSTSQISSGNQYLEQPLDRSVAIYANASYTYKNKYTVYSSARRDGANVFGVNTNNKWKPLWSVGGKWDISKEGFYNLNFIPNLSLRGSFGYSGNVNESGSGKLTIMYASIPDSRNRAPFAVPQTANNPDLRWEEVRQIDLGLDFDLFINRLSGRLDIFQKQSKDVIWNYPFDPTSGVNEYQVNSANLKGSGFDFVLSSKNIRRNFLWNTSIGLSYVKNIVTKIYRGYNLASAFVSYGLTPAIGKMPYSIASYRWAGINGQTGDPQGYLKGQISRDYLAIQNDSIDNQIIHGSSIPLYSGFLTNTFSWKGINLSFNITGRFSYYFRRPTLRLSPSDPISISNYSIDYYNRWKKPGDELQTNIPSILYPVPANMRSRASFYEGSEVNVLRGDHIRLQDIRLQYQWINKNLDLPFKSIAASFYPNNLNVILWRKDKSSLDPDFVGGADPNSTPLPKTWTIGINLTF